MKNYSHLLFEDRKFIESALGSGKSFKSIAKALGKSPSTISREVLRNSYAKRTGSAGCYFNDCLHRKSCTEYRLCDKEDCKKRSCKSCTFCFRFCARYEKNVCKRLSLPPYVCNGCHKRLGCILEKFIYKAKDAHKTYGQTLVSSRNGISITGDELTRLDAIVSPLLRMGQSPHVIVKNNKDSIMLDEKTIYKYVKAGLLSAKPLDLNRLVKLRPRKKARGPKVETACRTGRTYRDFLTFMDENPDTAVAQMDTLEGKKGDGEEVLLTIHFTQFQFMLAFLRPANTARSVAEAFNSLYGKLEPEEFTSLFPVILTDNGSEFTSPSSIEKAPDGKLRTRIFYCDPGAPYQKGAIENNHTLLRRVIPKGTSLNRYSQADIDLLMDHINSYPRKSLSDWSPHQSLSFFFPLLPEKLGVRLIEPNEIVLTPALLRR